MAEALPGFPILSVEAVDVPVVHITPPHHPHPDLCDYGMGGGEWRIVNKGSTRCWKKKEGKKRHKKKHMTLTMSLLRIFSFHECPATVQIHTHARTHTHTI